LKKEIPKKKSLVYWVYIVKCKGGQLYTGITSNVKRRLSEHQAQGPKCAKYLRGKSPLKLVFKKKVGTKSIALKAEAQLKKRTRGKKMGLVQKRFSLKTLLKK